MCSPTGQTKQDASVWIWELKEKSSWHNQRSASRWNATVCGVSSNPSITNIYTIKKTKPFGRKQKYKAMEETSGASRRGQRGQNEGEMRIWKEQDVYLAVLSNLHLFTLWHLSDVEVSLWNLQKQHKMSKWYSWEVSVWASLKQKPLF